MVRGRRYSYYDFGYYPPSTPLEAKGGIKAQSKKGAFAQKWWAKRWIEVLESFQIGARLGRGRSYARRGQVLSVDIEKGAIKAAVQGSRPKPYSVSIQVKQLTAAEWKKIVEQISQQPLFAAKLLAGEMPEDIEYVFHDLALSLFPSKFIDLKTECSCPDWSNPCKHIAAVFYLLGEEFDRDPFLIFKMRGLTRDELLSRLTPVKPTANHSPQSETIKASPEPLPADEHAFWQGGDLKEELWGTASIPQTPAALPKRLGNFPFWRGKESFLSVMEEYYIQASQHGLNAFLGEPLE
ncbi:MAG: SWIM zinc finger family protein [Candidatus Omnitrophota bacterium]